MPPSMVGGGVVPCAAQRRCFCTLLILLGAVLSVAGAPTECLPQHWPVSHQKSVCSLEIIGFGLGRPGIKALRFNCTGDGKVSVGFPTVARGNPLRNLSRIVRQQLEGSPGVEAASSLECQEHAELPTSSEDAVPLYPLLMFCSGNIHLVRPVIRDLWLPYTSSKRAQDDTAVVAVAGSASVTVTGAVVERVDASTTFAVLQGGRLTLQRSRFRDTYGNPGSAVFARESSVVHVSTSTFYNSSSSDFGGAVALMGCCNATVVDSVFERNHADISGGALYAIEASQLTLVNTTVTHSFANLNGGGIMSSARLNITGGSRVLHNTAGADGGGLYMRMAGDDQAVLQLSADCVLAGNKAVGNPGSGTGGGAYLDVGVIFDPVALQAVAHGNMAVRDADVGAAPNSLSLLSDARVSGYATRLDARTGLVRVQLLLQGAGHLPCGQRMVLAHWQPLAASDGGSSSSGLWGGRHLLQAVDPAMLAGGTDTLALDGQPPQAVGVTNASGVADIAFKLEQHPGEHNISFSVNRFPYLSPVVVTVAVRPCWRGEAPVQGRPGVCEVCGAGSFNFEAGLCLPCPRNVGADCPGGGVVLSKLGFWLSSPQHDVPHRCPNPQACLADRSKLTVQCTPDCTHGSTSHSSTTAPGPCLNTSGCAAAHAGSDFADQQCKPAYFGHLCGRCKPGYGSIRPFHCQRCLPRGVVVFMYVLAALLMLVLMKVMVLLTLRDSSRAGASSADGDAGPPQAEPSQLLRQLVLYSQYTLIIASVQAADAWPVTLSKPLQALAWLWSPASPHTLAPDCLAGPSTVPSTATKLVFYAAMPLALLTVLLSVEALLHAVWRWANRHARGERAVQVEAVKSSFKDRLVAAGLVMVFFFLPSIVRTAFGLFACIGIDKPAQPPYQPLAVGSFWLHDTNQACFAGWHLALACGMGIPLLAFVCAVPGFILYKTLPSGQWLTDRAWLQHYGFLVQHYKPSFRCWEAVVAVQTICLVALSVFSYTLGPYYQALIMNIAIAFVWLMLAVARPLASKDAHRVALASMGCLFLTSYSALAFAHMGRYGGAGAASLSLSDVEAAAIPLFMGVVVLAANLGFVAWVVWKLLRAVDWAGRWETIYDICDRRGLCCSWCPAWCGPTAAPAAAQLWSTPAVNAGRWTEHARFEARHEQPPAANSSSSLQETADVTVTLPGGGDQLMDRTAPSKWQ